MTFYLKPPRGRLNLYKLEKCVQQRLTFYNRAEDNNSEATDFECLIEDNALDRTGHYFLRLKAYSSLWFQYQFLKNEEQLLHMRLSSYDLYNTKCFLKRLLKHSQDNLKDAIASDLLKNLYVIFVLVATQMLEKDYLRHLYSEVHFNTRYCEEYIFNIPFEHCYSLIGNKEVELKGGYARITCRYWKRFLTSLYQTYLKAVLKEMRYSRCVDNALDDVRISEVLRKVDKQDFKRSYGNYVNQKFDLSNFQRESQLFPLCMMNLCTVLETTNRLVHNDRFDFSLFLKGIGVSVDDSLRFWEKVYSKQPSSCSRCTHNWKKNEKKYIYGVRHLYGLEGSRKDYQTRSCKFLQEKSLGPLENGGCPFKHFDDDNLKKILHRLVPDQKSDIEIIVQQRKEGPSVACRNLYKVMYTIATDCEAADFVFRSPVQYYVSLKEGIGNFKS